MLERKHSSTPGKALPSEWLESVVQLLNQSYQTECETHQRQFEVYGQLYPQELLVIFGFVPKKGASEGAVSCFLSCDEIHISSKEKVKETQANYLDIAGMLFDEYFADDQWSGWEPNWQEVEWKGTTYWYKMTRENVQLTLEADRLLRAAGFENNEPIDSDDLDQDKIIH